MNKPTFPPHEKRELFLTTNSTTACVSTHHLLPILNTALNVYVSSWNHAIKALLWKIWVSVLKRHFFMWGCNELWDKPRRKRQTIEESAIPVLESFYYLSHVYYISHANPHSPRPENQLVGVAVGRVSEHHWQTSVTSNVLFRSVQRKVTLSVRCNEEWDMDKLYAEWQTRQPRLTDFLTLPPFPLSSIARWQLHLSELKNKD